jgi:hypothetical protein
VNDELKLSLYLDGRLAPDEEEAFERRLGAEPELAAQLSALERLQQLSEGLVAPAASFGADDIRLRAHRWGGGWWRFAAAAAAVLLLAATHLGAFFWGERRGADATQETAGQTDALLERAQQIDYTAPRERLADELDELEAQVVSIDAKDVASEPGIRGISVALVANGEMRFVPASATSYTRLMPVGENRFRFIHFDKERGGWTGDEGTLAELQTRHQAFTFKLEK